MIEKTIFLTISPTFNLNSFLQTHLGAVGSQVPAFLIKGKFFGKVSDCLVRAVSINHCITPQTQGIMQRPTKIKTPVTMIKEVKIEVIQPFHFPNEFPLSQ
jgi:hypothetical protein